MSYLTDKLITTIIVGISLLSNACQEQSTEVKEINLEVINNNSIAIPKEIDPPTYLFKTGNKPGYNNIIDARSSEDSLARWNEYLESETEEEKLEREINSAPERIRYSNLK